MIIHTSCGSVELIHPSKLIDIIPNSIAHNTVEQYNCITSISPYASAHSAQAAAVATTYKRDIKIVEQFEDKEDFILKLFIKEMYGQVVKSKTKDFVEAVEDLTINCMHNFGLPTHIILFGDILIAGEFSYDVIQFRSLSPNQGTLIVFQPCKFSLTRLLDPCPYLTTEPFYDRYAAPLNLIETMKKLGLE